VREAAIDLARQFAGVITTLVVAWNLCRSTNWMTPPAPMVTVTTAGALTMVARLVRWAQEHRSETTRSILRRFRKPGRKWPLHPFRPGPGFVVIDHLQRLGKASNLA